jgi:hypothetical protein
LIRKKQVIEIPVNIYNLGKTIEGVFCRIDVPNKAGEDISISFFPTEKQFLSIGRAAHFSIEGTIKTGDSINLQVKSDEVWGEEVESKHITPNLTHTTIFAKALKLSICNVYSQGVINLKDDSVRFKGHFLISDSKLLKPFKIFTSSFTGERKLDTNKSLQFSLDQNLDIEFDTYYKYENTDDISSAFPILVAVFKTDHLLKEIESIENKLDDLLLLSSFAENKTILCFGKEIYSEKYKIVTYDKKWVSNEPDPFETLIDNIKFEEFIKTTYIELNKSPFKKDIIRAIYGLRLSKSTLEYSFISLFASLESIITSFKKSKDIDRIFSKLEWNPFKEELKTCLKSIGIIKDDKTKRTLLYEKMDELNRPSFKHGIKTLIDTYGIPLEGIWPIFRENNEISLLDIRNCLVHGEKFSNFNDSALHVAYIHLNWVVQRTILRLLNWDIEKTNIAYHRISKHNAFKELTGVMKSIGNA